MWPADALWELAQQIVTLVGIVVVLAFLRPERDGRSRLLPVSAGIEPRARRLLVVVALAALFTACGWLGQAATQGIGQTLAMALGGPTAEEVFYCRKGLAAAAPAGPAPACLFGGNVTRVPGAGWTCDKHGAP